ncbi:cupin [Sphingosinicella sp. BN140058]|uniref:cupin n=1 Tax=Sphingosinicella sp. BN140058 TaxID=1892855 RepID=UPI001011E0CE|nr:cupin [Sphingosinicella sp. BN140058]QAY78999.1 cupin [Sphingosinicella sp. BN140058]
MPLIVENPADYRADRAWGALDLAEVEGATARLHWTDSDYQWHVNDGTEVFAVLSGTVMMHYKADGAEKAVRLEPGAIFVAHIGEEHVARPQGEARILVIEKKGSI